MGLAAFLLGNSTVHTVNLEDNGLGQQGGTALFEALSKNSCVTELNVSGNALSGAMPGILGILQPGQFLRRINLERNKLGDKSLEVLAKGLRASDSLMELRLGSNSITDSGLATLCSGLSSPDCALRAIDLEWNSIKDVSPLVKCLQKGSNLVSVGIRWNKIGSAGARAIGKMLAGGKNTVLQRLDLSYNEIG